MRTIGALGISVGTSLAFELSNGEIRKPDTLLLNLRTIVRNAIDAYEPEDPDGKDATLVARAAKEDLIKLAEYINELKLPKALNFVLFNPSYKSLDKVFPHAKLWEPTTPNQIARAKLFKDVIDILVKELGKTITPTDTKTPDFNGLGMIITHHPVDLVLTKSQSRLILLESYTGAAKPRTLWFTKLTGDVKLFNMPLNKLTIQVFGDKSVNFRSDSTKIKKLVEEIAKKSKWDSGSTEEKVRTSINIHASGFDRTGLLNLMK